MMKSDLKNGMVVRVYNGNRYIVCGNKLLKVNGGRNGFLLISEYTDNLLCEDRGKGEGLGFDITAVFEAVKTIRNAEVTDKILWERKIVDDDWTETPVDTKVIAYDGGEWLPRYFARVGENGKPMVFPFGATSFSARGKISGDYKRVVLFEGNEHLLGGGEDE